MLTCRKIVGLFLRLNLTLLHGHCRVLISVDSVDMPENSWAIFETKFDSVAWPLQSVDLC